MILLKIVSFYNIITVWLSNSVKFLKKTLFAYFREKEIECGGKGQRERGSDKQIPHKAWSQTGA